ncbi:restriction endonuclease, partial [Micromonospora sp. NPDC047548]|uniref:restriction endonuclease n=1 Tax=Micromonospora sp. NPDC047548 TaxID=3155624 RepID=UPI0033C86113
LLHIRAPTPPRTPGHLNTDQSSPTGLEFMAVDLYGTMQHEGATTGILITTSGFGPSSYEFANGKPMQLIDAQGLLALCKEYKIPARIL